MKRALIAAVTLVALLALVVVTIVRRERDHRLLPGEVTTHEIPSAPPGSAPEAHRGFLYGRITTVEGDTYEGRLRWGGGEEAFWSDYFNGYKDENPWVAHVPPERLAEDRPIEIFGFRIADREAEVDLSRPFMLRFGEIARIEARGRSLLVTLKSGRVVDLNRLNADDLADGVRVWDADHGIVDLHERSIQSIDLLPTADLGAAPNRLHGTVRTSQGVFTGFVQWNRKQSVDTDQLAGRTADGDSSIPFDTIRSIARESSDSSRASLLDGREVVLSGTRDAGDGNLGLFVDDPRYGRVLIRWSAFERVDFSPGGSGPAYGDFPPGYPLTGSVDTRDGRRLTGRLVYDLDESETTATLDAPSGGVTYTIPFALIASISPAGGSGNETASVTLQSGEELQLEPAGDLGLRNAGLLVFADDSERAEHVPWTDVVRIDFDRPAAALPQQTS